MLSFSHYRKFHKLSPASSLLHLCGHHWIHSQIRKCLSYWKLGLEAEKGSDIWIKRQHNEKGCLIIARCDGQQEWLKPAEISPWTIHATKISDKIPNNPKARFCLAGLIGTCAFNSVFGSKWRSAWSSFGPLPLLFFFSPRKCNYIYTLGRNYCFEWFKAKSFCPCPLVISH